MALTVTTEGLIDPRWGRANRVAITEVTGSGIQAWREYDVRWDALHDAGTEGSHHARVARFLQEHQVQVVVANHIGEPMVHMLERMRLKVWLGAVGDAREAVVGRSSTKLKVAPGWSGLQSRPLAAEPAA